MPDRTCSVPGCPEKRKALGYCNRHYLRVLRNGEPGGLRPAPLPPTCSIDGCERKRSARGYCTFHYSRWHRCGDPLVTLRQGRFAKIEEAFWSRVDLSNPDGCWEWNRNRDDDGYGRFNHAGRHYLAHRWSFMNANSLVELGSGIVVRHHCDNPPCVRPDHLASGTVADNNADCVRRGRQARGDTHGARLKPHTVRRGRLNGMSKLNEDLVRQIRALCAAGEYQKHIAALTGVTQATVSKVKRRAIWAHVE